mgnify:CR=1 FL=1|jgi:hypothetical protein|tara:strand:- start:419 stop:1039 length:621 start_codon:yes stop_codon:yes gene_type:complete
MFCPQAVEWGSASDVANVVVGIVVAGATLWAVIVALQSSRRAEGLALRLRDAERQIQLEKEEAQRGVLAVALDRELYMVFVQAEYAWRSLRSAQESGRPSAIREALTSVPTKGFDLLERFTSEFSLFPPKTSSELLHTLGLLLAARNSPPPNFSDENAVAAAKAVGLSMAKLTKHARDARVELGVFIPDGIQPYKLDPLPPGMPAH